MGVCIWGAWPWLGGGAAGGWPSVGGGAAGGWPSPAPVQAPDRWRWRAAPGTEQLGERIAHRRAVTDPVLVHHCDADQPRVGRRRVAGAG